MPWYRVPVVWLGMLIFVASLAGCVWIIVASVHYRDEALDVPAHSVMGVPAHSRPAPASS
ncbi:MAG: hypothetical protein OJF55_001473 [Rhodanobacteraceae bacterium]|nr:MAG: hypothetical protein OJF55_001473 [Rhodanobacteraceae bacterium]